MKIRKEFKWEMGHKLSKSYTEKCTHLHGHSYRAEIEIEGRRNAEGVVVDFTRVKEVATPLIDALDHSFLVHKDDALIDAFIQMQREGKRRIGICDFNPTAENLALWIARSLSHAFNISKIVVWETATSYAEVCGDEIDFESAEVIRWE